ncbi:hypothetical protein EDC01DRAFT_743703 [Geopyxis carbonaria]|nr:hypothetical protein EDC01DRAFT_743703 [Geopyxis carbonaria]
MTLQPESESELWAFMSSEVGDEQQPERQEQQVEPERPQDQQEQGDSGLSEETADGDGDGDVVMTEGDAGGGMDAATAAAAPSSDGDDVEEAEAEVVDTPARAPTPRTPASGRSLGRKRRRSPTAERTPHRTPHRTHSQPAPLAPSTPSNDTAGITMHAALNRTPTPPSNDAAFLSTHAALDYSSPIHNTAGSGYEDPVSAQKARQARMTYLFGKQPSETADEWKARVNAMAGQDVFASLGRRRSQEDDVQDMRVIMRDVEATISAHERATGMTYIVPLDDIAPVPAPRDVQPPLRAMMDALYQCFPPAIKPRVPEVQPAPTATPAPPTGYRPLVRLVKPVRFRAPEKQCMDKAYLPATLTLLIGPAAARSTLSLPTAAAIDASVYLHAYLHKIAATRGFRRASPHALLDPPTLPLPPSWPADLLHAFARYITTGHYLPRPRPPGALAAEHANTLAIRLYPLAHALGARTLAYTCLAAVSLAPSFRALDPAREALGRARCASVLAALRSSERLVLRRHAQKTVAANWGWYRALVLLERRHGEAVAGVWREGVREVVDASVDLRVELVMRAEDGAKAARTERWAVKVRGEAWSVGRERSLVKGAGMEGLAGPVGSDEEEAAGRIVALEMWEKAWRRREVRVRPWTMGRQH